MMLTCRSLARASLLSPSHPSRPTTKTRVSPKLALAPAGWGERNPMGWTCWSPPWSPAPGFRQSLGFCWIWLRGYPGRLWFPSPLPVTSRRAATPPQLTAVPLLRGSAEALTAVSSPSLCSARYYSSINLCITYIFQTYTFWYFGPYQTIKLTSKL